MLSAELVLGRDHNVPDAETFVRDAALEPNGIKVISLTDLPGGNPALPPEAFIGDVLQHGLTPIAHLSGKDGNRSMMEARLHSMARLGVENILALTGDAHRDGSGALPKPVYDLDSALILAQIDEVRRGVRYEAGSRESQTTPFDFLPGAVVNPYKVREPDQMMQYYKLELKVAAGARFIITQLGFNLRKLYELRQYMAREGLGHIPVIANVYVPTATVAGKMRAGDISGCVIPPELELRLKGEKKAQRLERAALMVAAARDLGFAGAHIGGFGLSHRDVMTVVDRSGQLEAEWPSRMGDLAFEYPGEFYLLPKGADGLSVGDGEYQVEAANPKMGWRQRMSTSLHAVTLRNDNAPARFLSHAPQNGRRDLRRPLLGLANVYRQKTWGCVMCGDCIQEHLNFPGCTMALCYKELRNGPCGGSRVDGSCEVDDQQQCIWNLTYHNTLAAGDDPKKFAHTLIPPRDWGLNRSNAMVNRLAGLDNLSRRKTLSTEARQDDD